MKIFFIGCVESSKILLTRLLENNHEICGIATKEASGYNADFYDLSDIGSKYGIPTMYVKNINDKESVDFIKSTAPDVLYCFGWSQLLKEQLLNIPPMGAYGFHPAELPYNRGRHPIIWALVLGLKSTAVTFFELNIKADAGKIISQRKIQIAYEDDARSLYNKIMNEAEEQVLEFTEKLETGAVLPEIVPNVGGNIWRKRSEPDGIIDWRMSSLAIYNLVRALTKPYFGAEFVHQGKKVRVWKAEEVREQGLKNIEYGKVLKVNSETDYFVKTYDNVIHILDSDSVELKEGDYL